MLKLNLCEELEIYYHPSASLFLVSGDYSNLSGRTCFGHCWIQTFFAAFRREAWTWYRSRKVDTTGLQHYV